MLSWLSDCSAPASARPTSRSRLTLVPITVVVTNFARIPLEILNRATAEVDRTFRRMGVRTIWL